MKQPRPTKKLKSIYNEMKLSDSTNVFHIKL